MRSKKALIFFARESKINSWKEVVAAIARRLTRGNEIEKYQAFSLEIETASKEKRVSH